MVFESTLSALLNKFLGDFVENLDGNQLSIGIWGGDVELRDLVIKPSALEDFDLPIQTVYGTIGKLVLKIPWKSLYTSPWIIEVDGIYLLAAPNQQVKYDPIKEEKSKNDAKRKQLQIYEDKRKAEAAKGKPKADATFVEKLVTTIIKNVQLKVTNIHIRYEDRISNPGSAFACGLSLHTLLVESTDSNWQKAICEDMVKIFKIVTLEALVVYWNCHSPVFGNIKNMLNSVKEFLRETITSKNNTIPGFSYLLGPINADARLRMNQDPESDSIPFSIPKMQLNLDMEKLYLGLSKAQYRDIICLVDCLGRMSKGVPYRKYRPHVPAYRGYYKQWWKFAYTSILEEHIRRTKREWSWNNMREYRNRCKLYMQLYKKECNKTISYAEKQDLAECEKILDVTNIVLIRQQVEIGLERDLATKVEGGGWMSWFRRGSTITKQAQDSPLSPPRQSWIQWLRGVHPTGSTTASFQETDLSPPRESWIQWLRGVHPTGSTTPTLQESNLSPPRESWIQWLRGVHPTGSTTPTLQESNLSPPRESWIQWLRGVHPTGSTTPSYQETDLSPPRESWIQWLRGVHPTGSTTPSYQETDLSPPRESWIQWLRGVHPTGSTTPTLQESNLSPPRESWIQWLRGVHPTGSTTPTLQESNLSPPRQSWIQWLRGVHPTGSTTPSYQETNLIKEFEKDFTPAERQKLYEAIGYQENTAPTTYPKFFVANSVVFLLRHLEIELFDNETTILFTDMSGVGVRIEHRPGANAIRVDIKIDDFMTRGVQIDDFVPEMIHAERKTANALLEIIFETNPIDETFDQRIYVQVFPLKIVYDAQTINKVIDIFKIPPDTTLDQIQDVAGTGLDNMKEMTSTGLQYAIERHSRLDIFVDVQAPYVVIPHGGRYTGIENVLVVNLGRFKISSHSQRDSLATVHSMYEQGLGQEEIFMHMREHSYDNFVLVLADLQVLLAQGEEDWQSAIKHAESTDMHLLNPITFTIHHSKCLISDDPRFPLNKVNGKLSSIDIRLTEARILLLAALGTSIPLPNSAEPEPHLQPLTKKASSMALFYKGLQEAAKNAREQLEKENKGAATDLVQFTTLESKFILLGLSVTVSQQADINSEIIELARFKVDQLECELFQRTYILEAKLVLNSISLTQNHLEKRVALISSPSIMDKEEYLFKVEFTQVDRLHPEITTTYESCEKNLRLDFGILNILLHQECLLTLMAFSSSLQEQILELTKNQDRFATAGPPPKRKLSDISETGLGSGTELIKKSRKKMYLPMSLIVFMMSAELQEVKVTFANNEKDISQCFVKGIVANVIVKDFFTQVTANLQDITILDSNPESLYPVVLTHNEGTALKTQLIMNKKDEFSDLPDMEVTLKMCGARIVFLNYFVSTMLNFLEKFQAPQQKIIEASQAAAQQAKENMKEIYAKETRVLLDVSVKAPNIIIPVDSKSHSALLLDLGRITISNVFHAVDKKNEEGHPAVIDEMKITLSNLKLARIRMDDELKEIQNTELVEPVLVHLIVKRNLSTSWFTDVPGVFITGKIKIISVQLSQGDYRMVMSTLDRNLSEGETDTKKVVKVEPTKSQIQEGLVHVEVGPVVRTKMEKDVNAEVTLKFTFTMDKLNLNLYSGGDPWDIEEMPSLSAKAPLALFSLEGLAFKGRFFSDNSIVTSILLVNCILDDMRRGREDKLNRLIQRSDPAPERSRDGSSSSATAAMPRGMIDITYQKRGNDMFVDIRIFSFTIILSVDYLVKVSEFFKSEGEAPAAVQHKQTQTKTVASGREPSIQNVQVEDQETPSQMTINLKLEKPDIILMEHMDNIDTNAMILNGEIIVKLRLAGQHQVINGNINELQLYTCNYNPAHREETKGNVLHPLNISIAGSTPMDRGLHVELISTELRLSVSPTTIELLNRVLVTMTASGESKEDDGEEQFNYDQLWQPKKFAEKDYWFLKTDIGVEAEETADTTQETQSVMGKNFLNELCIITVPSIVFTLEAGVGNKTLPMILLECGFKGSARNWSSQLSVDASLTLQMGYYNSMLALWEPLIEPVEVQKNNKMYYEPWELRVEMSMNDQDDAVTSPTTSDSEPESAPSPMVTIDMTSDNTLEMTVTKTCLEVLRNLSKAFAAAIETSTMATATPVADAPYRVVNEIGEDITLLLEEGSFKVADGMLSVDLSKSAAVPLQLKTVNNEEVKLQLAKELSKQTQKEDKFLHIKVTSKNSEIVLPIGRADKRFFMLNYRGEGNDNWGLISDIKVEQGVTIITLRSIIKVCNHFCVPIDVYYMTAKGNELELIGTAQPNATINVPLKAVYTPTKEFFFAVSGHSVSSAPYVWKDLETNLSVTKVLQCPHKEAELGKAPFIIKCIGVMKQVYFEQTSRHTMASTCYNIHLRPGVIFKNFLPYDVVCCVDEQASEIDVKAGDTIHLPSVNPGTNVLVIRIPEYMEKEWSCRHEIEEEPKEFAVWTFHSYDSAIQMSLDLGMHTEDKNGSFTMALYCPLWMLNKTGLMIAYRETDEHLNIKHHPPHFKGPILFSYNARNFFGKKKASIRVERGYWCKTFSLDVAGSSGFVTCIANDRNYQIGVHNQLTYNNLTKQITFTPYYVIINNAPYIIECQEYTRPADHWLTVEPKSCTALWPNSDQEDKLLRIRVAGTEEISAPFLYTESHNTLLRLNNKYGGINVDIQTTEGSVYINMIPYDLGCAPALLVNHTSDPIVFWEKESVQKRTLEPSHSMLFTWENPSGPRLLVWDKGNQKEILNDLKRDTCGEFSPKRDKKVYWASFLDGFQRVLLFTEVQALAESAEASNLLEVIKQEVNVAIHGIGLSLVDNILRREIMYLGIASSGVVWQTCRMNGKRYKSLNQKTSTLVENAYQYHLRQQMMAVEVEDHLSNIDGKMVIDFWTNVMVKPYKKKMRRSFQTGLWVQMKTSPNQMQLHAKINRLQIDNQIFDCIFPVVLAPVPPPKSVAIDSGIKPFMELSIVELLMKNSQIKQFKYFKVLIQEFEIKVDLGFVSAVLALLQEAEQSDEEEKKLFLLDKNLVDEPLYTRASGESLKEQKSFYDLLHFSPLKIHISFSMAAGSSQNVKTPNFLNILLQGIGVTLTDLQDVVFKLAFFERSFTFLTQRQLIDEVTKHYIGQSVKQLYVLVLGLDVLGNPFGLVLGITKGVEDLFYEPIQGAIQGPGEFAEGLALGMKSLFGHTVGGAAGAVSRITGAMGKGIAVLTFDEDYQRRRRDQMNKKPASAAEGIARSSKGLVMGVVSGVTGVVTKPISGAREEGVEGFFKGLGKGAVGLVTRPVAGVVDFASGSLDVVKRCTESGEEVTRLRSPRFMPPDGLVKPYNKKEAYGQWLLMELSKGKFARTDVYSNHQVMVEGREVVLMTDKRIAYVYQDMFGAWQIDWSYTWQELSQPPKIVPKGVSLTFLEKKKRLFGPSDTTKVLLIGDPELKESICLTIESLRGT